MKKKVCLDVNSIVPLAHQGYLSGIGRTTLELVQAFAKMENLPIELTLYTQNVKGITSKTFDLPFKSCHVYLRDRASYAKLVRTLRLRELLTGYDLYHAPHNFGYPACPEKTLLTIHDAMFFSYPEDFLGHEFARNHWPDLARKCKGIVTCSASSKRDIVQYMGIPEDKVTVIPWGVSSNQFYRENEDKVQAFKTKHGLTGDYYIMASCDIGRKNTELLMENFVHYRANGGQNILLLIWKNPPERLTDKYRKEIESKQIIFLGGISDDDLRLAYNGAVASFFPSKYEGFGLPILESLACGTPVVTCRNSSLEEVGGKTAFYVSEDSPTEMSQYMIDFEKGKHDLDLLREKALLHVKDFTWKQAAERYLEWYLRCL